MFGKCDSWKDFYKFAAQKVDDNEEICGVL